MCDNFQMPPSAPFQAIQRPVYQYPFTYWSQPSRQIMTPMGTVNLHSYAQTALAPSNTYYNQRSTNRMTIDGKLYHPNL
jgi:hypothetical protein